MAQRVSATVSFMEPQSSLSCSQESATGLEPMKQNRIHLHSFYLKVNIMSKQNVYIRKYEHNTCKTKHCIKVMIRSPQALRSWFPDCRMSNIIRKIKEANLFLSEALSTRSHSLPFQHSPPPKEIHSNGDISLDCRDKYLQNVYRNRSAL